MKLSNEQINFIADKLNRLLKDDDLVTYKTSEQNVKNKIFSIIQSNINEEKTIDNEVKQILKENEVLIKSSNMSYSKLFTMTKKKIAKDKKFIL